MKHVQNIYCIQRDNRLRLGFLDKLIFDRFFFQKKIDFKLKFCTMLHNVSYELKLNIHLGLPRMSD